MISSGAPDASFLMTRGLPASEMDAAYAPLRAPHDVMKVAIRLFNGH